MVNDYKQAVDRKTFDRRKSCEAAQNTRPRRKPGKVEREQARCEKTL
jgi:hypothetical protein